MTRLIHRFLFLHYFRRLNPPKNQQRSHSGCVPSEKTAFCMTSEAIGGSFIPRPTTVTNHSAVSRNVFALAIQSLPRCPTNPPRGRLDGDYQETSTGTHGATEENLAKKPLSWNRLTAIGFEPELTSSLEGDHSGQCWGSPDPPLVGEKVSMSQRGPISRPPSRRRSYSQSTDAHTSPSLHSGLSAPHDSIAGSPQEPGGAAIFQGHEPLRQATPRSLGVHTILNPSNPREQQLGSFPPTQRAYESGSSPSSAGTRQHGVSGSPHQTFAPRPPYGGPTGPGFLPGPVTSVPPLVQQESPTPVRPFPPALGAARRMLTARSPRPPSLSRVATPSSYADPQTPFDYAPPSMSRPGGAQDLPPFSGPPPSAPQQPPRNHPLPAVPYNSVAPRSFSQPAYHSNAPAFQFPQQPPRAGQVEQNAQGSNSPYPQGQYGLPQGRASGYTPSTGPSGDPNLSNAIMNALQTGGGGGGSGGGGSGGSHRGQDSHPHLTLQTNTGEHITVPLDVHQGSRQADEKRHRNAGASARFRARKKERDKDMRDTLNRLESESRDVARHNQELQVELEFYRNERNRLRDIVLRTPEIREHAERAPPSPRSSRPAAPLSRPGDRSFASSFMGGSSSPSTSPTGPPQHPPPYSGDLERPTRRRRTDPPSAEFGTSPYPMRPAHPPSTLPPIITQGFGAPIASAPPSARLPPLRFDQPASVPSPTAAQTPGAFGTQPPAPPPLQTQFSPYGRPPHEMGWARDPRDPRGEQQQQQQRHQSPGPPGP